MEEEVLLRKRGSLFLYNGAVYIYFLQEYGVWKGQQRLGRGTPSAIYGASAEPDNLSGSALWSAGGGCACENAAEYGQGVEGDHCGANGYTCPAAMNGKQR